MKVITEGHRYTVKDFESGNENQFIQFIQKDKEPNGSKLTTVIDGTTNEELLQVLIDRTQYLQSKFPCRENAIAITNLEQALMWLEKRTSDRIKRGVEGKHLI